MLLRLSLSSGELDAAHSALQDFQQISTQMNQLYALHFFTIFSTTVDQVRLWIASGELDRASRWVKDRDLREQHGFGLPDERQEVARARILLAQNLPVRSLERLEPVLNQATVGQRWGHVIEIRLLQALAWQMHGKQTPALDALVEAVHLAEPEGYIRSFVDEGAPMQALLSRLREKQCKSGPTPYLDTLLAAFQEQRKGQKRQIKRARPRRRSSMDRPVNPNASRETATKASASFSSQLLATKFFVPVTSGTLISRPRLIALLDKGLTYPFTLVSAPAGFGKTTLLSTWAQSLSANTSRLCWVSLDEEDNDPRLFWTYVLTALDMQGPHRFKSLLMHLQSQPPPPLKPLLTGLVNLLAESQDHFVLILDDYQWITEEQVHTSLSYLIEHLPPQLHIIIATRADPPLPLSMQRARQHMLEIRTEQLRCTAEETNAFFDEVMHLHLPDQTIQEATARTEGWLVGLHLLGLSLPERADPLTILQQISGDQRYILDYLTQEVLQRQPQEIQAFLLSTCILERLNASLCDAIMQQTDSQQLLQQLERANVFVTCLDSRRQWYRYHAIFAEALQHQLKQTHADLVPLLHHRASLWYAQYNQTTEAILHAFKAKEWQRATDLIEGIPFMSFSSWGAREHKLTMLQNWLEQLPTDIVGSRPLLCFACTQVLWAIAPPSLLNVWFDTAEKWLTASLTMQTHTPQARQEQENLLGQYLPIVLSCAAMKRMDTLHSRSANKL